jgi:small multidrug resistance pump
MMWLVLGAAIAAELVGTLAMRASEGFTRLPWLAVTAIGYVVAFVLLAQVLKLGMPVGIAYGIWSGVGVAITAVAGRVIWDDPLTLTMAVGIALIIGGVLLVETGSH